MVEILRNNKIRLVGILISFILLSSIVAHYLNLEVGLLEWANYVLIVITTSYVIITAGLLEEAQIARRLQYKPALSYGAQINAKTDRIEIYAENGGLGPARYVHFYIRFLNGKRLISEIEQRSDFIYARSKVKYGLPYTKKKLEELQGTDIEILIDYEDIGKHPYSEHGIFSIAGLMNYMNVDIDTIWSH